ncbi:5-formyltetrahydrofolate cyclo-ligase [Desulfohalovibrio reitneri]|uniref:5-formyltetrahydrofolate cyclo-ligase n=1 Tax=Desulfohalovibrio reitneri TaxID=1307759 RepID=UPI0004A717F8|nr:5-formyltetrahydrofolate cyclo-ligase [Desulfohalovibrio reitneri]
MALEQPDKDILRREMLERRDGLPPGRADDLSDEIQARAMRLGAFREAAEALLYMAVRGEVRTLALVEELWRQQRRVLLPRCRPDDPGELDLACASCFEEITPGRFSIPEPDPEACRALEDASPAVTFIPGVAFGRDGSRLGMGGGYYDRLLVRPGMARTLRVGLAYGFQVVDSLPREEWDQPVHLIITESETIEVG